YLKPPKVLNKETASPNQASANSANERYCAPFYCPAVSKSGIWERGRTIRILFHVAIGGIYHKRELAAQSRKSDTGLSAGGTEIYAKLELPMRYLSMETAALRPSEIAHTTSDWPRRISPAAKILGTEVM